MSRPIPFSISDIEKALSVKSLTKKSSDDFLFSAICTDSRHIQQNDFFLALKGENFDGERFVIGLANKGIKGFVVLKGFFERISLDQKNALVDQTNKISIFETENTLSALGSLAKFQRLRSNAKIIAITGSSGKTTTRELTGQILKNSFKTLTTKGNFNNEIGLPLTLLRLSEEHELAVVEMGMNHPGEIARLSNIALPDIGIITNTSVAHLEGLGSVDNVALAKSEMFQNMNENSLAIINSDDPRFDIMESKAKENSNINTIIRFGVSTNADIKASNISHGNGMIHFSIQQKDEQDIDLSINCPAPFMVLNALAASIAALKAGAGKKDISKALKAFKAVKGRMNFIKFSDKLNLIDDTYNANPDSVKQSIKTLALMAEKDDSIAILGDMLELGKDSINLHKEIGILAIENQISKLYTHGELSSHIVKEAVSNGFPEENTMNGTKKEIAKKVMRDVDSLKHSWVLVKGSRGMEMEKVIQAMENIRDNNTKMEKSA